MSASSSPNLRNLGFQLLEEDLRYVMQAFAGVLQRMGEPELAVRLPWIHENEPVGEKASRSLGQAYSIAFQLLNIVEERAASQVRRLREKQLGPTSEKGLWPDNLKEMIALRLTQDDILSVL